MFILIVYQVALHRAFREQDGHKETDEERTGATRGRESN